MVVALDSLQRIAGCACSVPIVDDQGCQRIATGASAEPRNQLIGGGPNFDNFSGLHVGAEDVRN